MTMWELLPTDGYPLKGNTQENMKTDCIYGKHNTTV